MCNVSKPLNLLWQNVHDSLMYCTAVLNTLYLLDKYGKLSTAIHWSTGHGSMNKYENI